MARKATAFQQRDHRHQLGPKIAFKKLHLLSPVGERTLGKQRAPARRSQVQTLATDANVHSRAVLDGWKIQPRPAWGDPSVSIPSNEAYGLELSQRLHLQVMHGPVLEANNHSGVTAVDGDREGDAGIEQRKGTPVNGTENVRPSVRDCLKVAAPPWEASHTAAELNQQ